MGNRRGIFYTAHKAAYSVSVGVRVRFDIWVRCVSKGQYKAIQGSIDGFIFTTAYALVTGGVFFMRRIKPLIACIC